MNKIIIADIYLYLAYSMLDLLVCFLSRRDPYSKIGVKFKKNILPKGICW